MILFTLRCSADHEFEAWFRDGAAYEAQAAAREIACPECGDAEVEKAPMAPSLARARSEPSPADMRRMLQQVRRHVESNFDYVGEKFAEEARKIHEEGARLSETWTAIPGASLAIFAVDRQMFDRVARAFEVSHAPHRLCGNPIEITG
jgi:hypothetical protein